MANTHQIHPASSPGKGNRTKALLALGFVCVSWGTTWVASRLGVQYMPALQMAGIRQFLAGSIYIIFFLARRASWPRGREWGVVVVLSLLNFFLTNGLTTLGVKYISAGLGAIIAAIFPLWLVLFGLFSRQASHTPLKAHVGLWLGFGGVCVIFYDHLKDFLHPDFRFGIIISLAGSVSWAMGTVLTKKEASQFNPYFSIGLQMALSGLLLYGSAAISGQTLPLGQIPAQAWMAISYLVLMGSVLSFLAFLYALQHLPTQQLSIYAYMNPVVAVLVGSWISSERLSWMIGLGGAIALLGVYLVNQSYKFKAAEPETS